VPGFVGAQEVMRQYHLRSIMALIAVIAVSIWIGTQIERGWPSRRIVHTVDKPVALTTTVPSYATRRPVRQQSKVKRQRSAEVYPGKVRGSNPATVRPPFDGVVRGLE
jgi:hypothetical protein